ncbi:MAG: peptide deformylase [Rhodospirillales bacterium]|nr:MAG: peptide deformylase [Rhodospirillales bacterium]
MAILKIARMGHPVLRRRADPVPDAAAPEVARLIADMRETLADIGGIGLAAPQVHVPLRLVIFSVPAARAGDPEAGEGAPDGPVPFTVLINPEIEVLDDRSEVGLESCLSVPGLAGMVPRFRRLRYRAEVPGGGLLEREAAGFHARVIQHECDHLDGVLYPMRMTDLSLLGFTEEMARWISAAPNRARATTAVGDGG